MTFLIIHGPSKLIETLFNDAKKTFGTACSCRMYDYNDVKGTQAFTICKEFCEQGKYCHFMDYVLSTSECNWKEVIF